MSQVSIRVNLEPLETRYALPYLKPTIYFNNSNWETLYGNLRKAQWRWGMMVKFLVKMGEMVPSRAIMYKALVQTVLIYWSECWLVMDAILKVLEGLHYWVARRISWMSDQ